MLFVEMWLLIKILDFQERAKKKSSRTSMHLAEIVLSTFDEHQSGFLLGIV